MREHGPNRLNTYKCCSSRYFRPLSGLEIVSTPDPEYLDVELHLPLVAAISSGDTSRKGERKRGYEVLSAVSRGICDWTGASLGLT